MSIMYHICDKDHEKQEMEVNGGGKDRVGIGAPLASIMICPINGLAVRKLSSVFYLQSLVEAKLPSHKVFRNWPWGSA